ncbi:MAG: hypothetical protein KJO49_02060 [Bacteroidia bacterium]|nr:hypothetical protein [Bacteroidia bacterium]
MYKKEGIIWYNRRDVLPDERNVKNNLIVKGLRFFTHEVDFSLHGQNDMVCLILCITLYVRLWRKPCAELDSVLIQSLLSF